MPSSLREAPQSLASSTLTLDEPQPMHWLRSAIKSADRFVRLHFLGFTFFLVLLGGVSVRPSLFGGELLLLIAVGVCFHNFAYVFNDVIDLPVDRTQPARRDDFLVRGVIQPWQALTFALAQIPLAVIISLRAGVAGKAVAVLLLGFGLMAVYDLWGKKCPIPPLTDLAQGLGWGCLVLFAAMALGEPVNTLTWVAFASGVGFIFLINGVHGGLRDLANDLRQGSRTTAIYFGSRPRPEGASVNRSLKAFALSVQVFLILTLGWPLVFEPGYFSSRQWWLLVTFLGLLQGVNLVYMLKVFCTESPSWGRDFRLHLLLLLLGPAVLLWTASMDGAIRWLFPILFLGPFLLVEVAAEITHLVLARVAGLRARTLGGGDQPLANK